MNINFFKRQYEYGSFDACGSDQSPEDVTNKTNTSLKSFIDIADILTKERHDFVSSKKDIEILYHKGFSVEQVVTWAFGDETAEQAQLPTPTQTEGGVEKLRKALDEVRLKVIMIKDITSSGEIENICFQVATKILKALK